MGLEFDIPEKECVDYRADEISEKQIVDDYDTYGAKYIIEDNYLISQFMSEEIYRWGIIGGQEGKDIEFHAAIAFEENSFFFNSDHVYVKANVTYDDAVHSKFAEETACAEVIFIKQYEQGKLYKLAVEPLGRLTDESWFTRSL